MARFSLKPQITYTAITVFTYGLLSYFVYRYGSVLKVGKLYQVPLVALLEVLKMTHIRRKFKLQGVSIVSEKSAPGGLSILRESAKFALLLFAAITVTFVACLIFGAPITSNHDGTLTLATLLPALVVLPYALLMGARGTVFAMFASSKDFQMGSITDDMFLKFLNGSAAGAILGAWVGSVVYPLDWDRPWQAYPLPNVLGVVAGHALGCVISLISLLLTDIKKELDKVIL